MKQVELAGALLAVIVTATAVWTQSLGEVARKEEERRKAITSPGRVYTNESLRGDAGSASSPPPAGALAPPPTVSQPSGPSAAAVPSRAGGPGALPEGARAPGAAPSGAGPGPNEEPKKDETYWRDRIQRERDGLQRFETFAAALQSRINALSTDFVNRDDPAQRNVIAADRQRAIAELERVKKDLQQHTKAIADIQEEARRSGALASWFR